MTIIVEDGTGKADAESYAAVATADAYWLARNDTVWGAATTGAKEAALREATLYMDGTYEWIGVRHLTTQALGWPRAYTRGLDSDNQVVPSDAVPLNVAKACCELAYEALSARLAPSADRGGLIKSETVGPLSVTYMDGAPGRKNFAIVDLLLKRLSTSNNTSISGSVVRG